MFRQIAMNRFEETVHTARRSEGELAPDRSPRSVARHCQRDALRRLGRHDGLRRLVELHPALRVRPGYVYAYAYGYLFSLAIYRRYEVEGDAMVEPYFDLLRKGGSESPSSSRRSSDSTSPTRRSGPVGSTRSTSCSVRRRPSRTRRSNPLPALDVQLMKGRAVRVHFLVASL